MNDVEEFFHYIAPKIIELTKSKFGHTSEIKYKEENSLNLSTDGDTDNEKLIKEEIIKRFPNDVIIAEETSSNTNNIGAGRVWIVDPICGSANFKNGIKFFATNIALAEEGKLIASCVIDHCREEYIWSTGDMNIYINKDITKPEQKSSGRMIEVDLSAIHNVSTEIVDRHTKLISYLLKNTKYYLSSFCTSLPFPYVALGRIDGYINGFNHIWDVAAANFLIMQAGGTVTQMDGTPWTLQSNNVLATLDKELHNELLNMLKNL